MNKMIKGLLLTAAVSLTAGVSVAQANDLDKLLEQVKKNRISEIQVNKAREAEFNAARADKQALLRKAQRDLKNEEARGDRLAKEFADNEIRLANKEQELINAQGTLGEMFGVVRQASGEAYGRITNSIISAQYPGRDALLSKLSEAKEIPSLPELEDLWIALQTEMTESGKVVRFNTLVNELNGDENNREIIRVGTFNIVDQNGYLIYDSDNQLVRPLGKQPEGHITSMAQSFNGTNSGLAGLYIDPSQGTILGLETAKATLEERYHQGGLPGYVITGVFLLGVLIAIIKVVTLTLAGAKIRTQLKDTSNPSSSNALGRILKVYHENKGIDAESLELKLDEAILRETPSIESGVNLIKILAAIAPLLGLLGTVTGMIGTFQTITLYGTGDPKLMAGDISMALVTTAQGLIAALPLILLHSIVAGRSKSIVHILDEQAAGIVAAHAETEKA